MWAERAALEAADLLPEERRLYHDFGIARGSLIGCPVNFHNLTPGWYCNEPPAGTAPNVRVGSDFSFFACADIAAGEELTVSYAEFSDPPGPEPQPERGSFNLTSTPPKSSLSPSSTEPP